MRRPAVRLARKMRRLAVLTALLAGALLATPAQAQGRGSAPGDFDFYVLSLSWSPGFCAIEGDRKRNEQCRRGSGYGFVVHGLWPQNERGFPTECSAFERSPSRFAMEKAREVLPTEGLARHQWRKHGTCSGLSPADYFAATARARQAVKIPAAFANEGALPSEIAPLDLERAFAAANPGLRPDMMAVTCQRSQLQEVRICFTKDLRGFRPCPEVDRDACRVRDLRVEPVR